MHFIKDGLLLGPLVMYMHLYRGPLDCLRKILEQVQSVQNHATKDESFANHLKPGDIIRPTTLFDGKPIDTSNCLV